MSDFFGHWRFAFWSLDGQLDAKNWRRGIGALILILLAVERVLTAAVDHDGVVGRLLTFTLLIVSLYPFTALCAKRFRDRGRPGDLAFVVTGPCAAHAVLNANDLLGRASSVGVFLGLAILFGSIWFLLELGFCASVGSTADIRS